MARFQRAEAAVVATAAALVFSRVFGFSIVLPGFRAHYEAAFGASALAIGIALGAHGLTMALVQWPLGALSDRIGRRGVLVVGSLVFVAGSVWAALAGDIVSLTAARFLQGLGTVSAVAMAAVGERVPAERRTQAMAFVGIPAGAGFFLGLLAGPLLSPIIGVPGLFWVTALVGLAAGLPALWIPLGHAGIEAPRVGRLAFPVLALATAGFANNYALQTIVFYLPDWRLVLPTLVVALLVVGYASRRIDRLSLTWQAPAAALGATVIAAPLLLFAGPIGILVGGALFFSAHGVLSTSLPGQVSRISGRSGGSGHGIQNVIAYTGTFAGGAAAGAFAPHAAWAVAALAAVALLAAAALARSLGGPTRALAAA